MSNETSLLYSITRSKLHESTNKEQCSLHRWVLLKNSILSSSSLQNAAVSEYSETISNVNEETDEEVAEETVVDAFMFPDAGNFVSSRSAEAEAQWLDSLLETLAEDEDDDYPSDSDHHSALPVDEDDDQLLSPSLSPLASSEDLYQSRFFSSSVSVPYSPYFDSTLALARHFESALDSPAPSVSTSIQQDAPSYHGFNGIESSSVPDAIEDMSDDESDTVSTPSFGRSIASLFFDSNADSASPTSSTERKAWKNSSRSRPPHYLNPFELDPLPFADESSHPTFYNGH